MKFEIKKIIVILKYTKLSYTNNEIYSYDSTDDQSIIKLESSKKKPLTETSSLALPMALVFTVKEVFLPTVGFVRPGPAAVTLLPSIITQIKGLPENTILL